MKLFCIGCGPGDPELVTVRAADLIKNADEIASAVRTGKKVIYLTVGDPALYSTWIYIQRELKRTHKDIEIEIVPGVTSMFAIAAKAGISLAEGDETVA